jgi:hypothetical protein
MAAGLSMYSDASLFRVAVGLGREIAVGRFLVPVMARFDYVPDDASPLALLLGLKMTI